MGGQKVWNDHGAETNAAVVMPEVVPGLYRLAETKRLFGKLNAGRTLDTVEGAHKGNSATIGAGAESPVWEKKATQNNTAIFTLEEPETGQATYGDANPKPGEFSKYLHSEVQCRRVRSPAFPIVGFESADNFKRVDKNLKASKKAGVTQWCAEEMDFDAFRALFMGRSRGLGLTVDGGKGIKLFNGSEGQMRVPWNCFVPGVAGGALIDQSAESATTHNNNLRTALNGLVPTGAHHFTYATHKLISRAVDGLKLRSVKLQGRVYRAIAITDQDNIDRLRTDASLVNLWASATPRSDENMAIYSRGWFVLDDILYLPTLQMRYFRATNTHDEELFTFGAGDVIDPRTYVNTSNITTTFVLGRGALMRAYRDKALKFTYKEHDHETGLDIVARYDDGLMRREWYNQDEREAIIKCDSMFAVFNCDAGLDF